MPEDWKIQMTRWATANEKHKTKINDVLEPRRNTEYLIYQTLLGVWPLEEMKPKEIPDFADRIWQYVLKAIREAKIYTNWVTPNLEYEEAVKKFIENILSGQEENLFLKHFIPFQKKISRLGMLNSLSALNLKLGSPGVVDIYQGNELWNYCLVDPDNRKPVDYKKRIQCLDKIEKEFRSGKKNEKALNEMVSAMENGPIKMLALWKGLTLRNQMPEVFVGGDYIPLKVTGQREKNIIAFLRKDQNRAVLVASSRFFNSIASEESGGGAAPEIWADTKIVLPKEEWFRCEWQDVYTANKISPIADGEEFVIKISELFDPLHFSMLTNVPAKERS
jgi:(1->4)-alpha-D-glucan 1-alpha-D-glucosylmutase